MDKMTSDFMSKPLQGSKFRFFRNQILGEDQDTTTSGHRNQRQSAKSGERKHILSWGHKKQKTKPTAKQHRMAKSPQVDRTNLPENIKWNWDLTTESAEV